MGLTGITGPPGPIGAQGTKGEPGEPGEQVCEYYPFINKVEFHLNYSYRVQGDLVVHQASLAGKAAVDDLDVMENAVFKVRKVSKVK